MLSRQQLEALKVPDLRKAIKDRNLHNYSNLNKLELIDFYLNPPASSATKSPGRPHGKPSAPKAKSGPKPKTAVAFSVQYTQDGLNNVNLAILRKLAEQKAIEAPSGKSKEELVKLLLTKQHHSDITIVHVSKAGNSKTVTIQGSHAGAGASSVYVVSQPAMAALPPPTVPVISTQPTAPQLAFPAAAFTLSVPAVSGALPYRR